MRVRTEEKRGEIVRIASQLFEELGYDRTSMSLISERLGGSKATLYGYFRSKEELLQAVLDHDVSEVADRVMNQILAGPDLREALVQLGTVYLMRRLSSTPIANLRTVANLPEGTDTGKRFYENVLRPAWQRLADRFEKMMDEGRLKRADPWIAAMHWKGLNEWDMLERRLLGAISAGDPQEISRAATCAADAFLKLYGVDEDGEAKPMSRKRAAKKG
jgi:AcrR family transcriptional regulator